MSIFKDFWEILLLPALQRPLSLMPGRTNSAEKGISAAEIQKRDWKSKQYYHEKFASQASIVYRQPGAVYYQHEAKFDRHLR